MARPGLKLYDLKYLPPPPLVDRLGRGPPAGGDDAVWPGRRRERGRLPRAGSGEPNVIPCDIGGTSADVCLVKEYRARTTFQGTMGPARWSPQQRPV